ncbi:MAG: cob(I)yrinic acid a,c-diamide adenosyltransferase [Myxococcota bacterium]
MKLYTKRGDAGETDLFGGERVSKAHPQVLAYGSIDAANAAIGFAAVISMDLQPELRQIMSDLFDAGAELASVATRVQENSLLTDQRIEQLEQIIDTVDAQLPQLKNFVLPTGSELAARLHLARTAVRRAEQEVILAKESGTQIRPQIIKYLNRLSDLLFAWSRLANINTQTEEILWAKP